MVVEEGSDELDDVVIVEEDVVEDEDEVEENEDEVSESKRMRVGTQKRTMLSLVRRTQL